MPLHTSHLYDRLAEVYFYRLVTLYILCKTFGWLFSQFFFSIAI